jgi:hypothetical protein
VIDLSGSWFFLGVTSKSRLVGCPKSNRLRQWLKIIENGDAYAPPPLFLIMTFFSPRLSTLAPSRFHRLLLDGVLFVFAGINALVLGRLAHIYWQIM